MPPNSFCEWMVGQNIRTKKKPGELRSVVSLEVLTDDESGSDVYKIAMPRAKRTIPKKVRFDGEVVKPSLKEPSNKASDSDLSTDVSKETSEDEETLEEPDSDCPCTACIKRRQKLKRKKQAKAEENKKTTTPSEEESEGDAAVHAKYQAKKNKKAHADKVKKGGEGRSEDIKAKQKEATKIKKKKGSTKSESDSTESSVEDTAAETEEETDEETEMETEEETEEKTKPQSAKKKGKQKEMNTSKGKANSKTKSRGKQENKQQAKTKKGGKKGDQTKYGNEDDKSASEPESMSETTSESEDEAAKPAKSKEMKKSGKKVSFSIGQPVRNIRQANLLLPPRASVMQVEHAVEVPNDPRPNAFYDNGSGTMRVYHGPAYGNPYGMLYPKQFHNLQNSPVGVPHPTQNPRYSGFPTVNEQPGPLPVPPPGGGSADEKNPWFRGWGTVKTAPTTGSIPPAPDFTAGIDPKVYRDLAAQYSLSPTLRSHHPSDRDAGWNSNVVPLPSVEVTAPDGSPAKGSDQSNRSTAAKAGDASSDYKKSAERLAKQNQKILDLGKALRETAERDEADMRAREERWSNRSGSKETSPQPTSWNNNENNGTGWGNMNNKGGSGNGWNIADTGTGGGNDWNTRNANTGGDSAWDNTAANNNNNNNNNDNNQWGGNDTNNNDWGNANNQDWGINNNYNNNNTWDSANNADNEEMADDNNNDNSPSPTIPMASTPIPGTWASPVPSNRSSNSNKVPSNWSGGNVAGPPPPVASFKSKGKGKAVESGNTWGDATAAQSSGGYWESAEGRAALAKGATRERNKNESWW
ncbi:hypothetical protein F5Y19DRAFT_127810 [Xylariaceae sp. FL1651]|nr:hypothetical protein F5Y19DRAFT_127810 [Xylariaceae sp. FL1651]